MTIEISSEIGSRLAEEAAKLGITVDALLGRLIEERTGIYTPVKSKPELPVWHLGATGPLHRQDIYIDQDEQHHFQPSKTKASPEFQMVKAATG